MEMEVKTGDCSNAVQEETAPQVISLTLGSGGWEFFLWDRVTLGVSGQGTPGLVEHKSTVQQTGELAKVSTLNVETSLTIFSHLLPIMLVATVLSSKKGGNTFHRI